MYKYIIIFDGLELRVYTSNSKTEFLELMRFLVECYHQKIYVFSKSSFERSKSKIVYKARKLMKDEYECKVYWCKSSYMYSERVKILEEL